MASQVMWWVWAGSTALAGLGALGAIAAFNNYWQAPRSRDADEFDTWIQADDLHTTLVDLSILIWLGTFVVFIIFLFQTHKAQDRFPLRRTWSRGWTIGAWFIPAANLVIPAMVVNEIEGIASTDGRRSGQPKVWIGTVGWWLPGILGVILNAVGSEVYNDAVAASTLTSGDADQIIVGYIMMAVAAGFLAGAGLLGGFMTRRISRADNLGGVPADRNQWRFEGPDDGIANRTWSQ